MNPYIFLVVGLVLIFLEFFLPGAVIGSIGGLFILFSIILFASTANSGVAVFAYVTAILLFLFFLVKFAIWRIRQTKSKGTIYSDDAQVGYVASVFDQSAIGKRGIVLSDLKPGGYILIEGKKEQALSVSGYLIKGSEVEVVGGQEESLIVKPINNVKET